MLSTKSITQTVCEPRMPTAHIETSSGLSSQRPSEREEQRDVAEIEEIGWAVIVPVDRNQHRHERGVGELEPQRQAVGGRGDDRVSAVSPVRARAMRDAPLRCGRSACRTTRSQRCAQRVIVRHQHERGAALAWPANIRSTISRAGRLVEIAGRLVGDQDGGMRRERARERDALLLAAGELRRIVLLPLGEPDRGEFARARREGIAPRRRARAAPRRSPAPSWSGSDGTTGTRCRSWRPRKRASASSSSRPRSSPATTTEPVSAARARPSPSAASTCPNPTGRPGRSPRRALYSASMSLRIWTRAAPRAEREVDARERHGRRDGRTGGGLDRGIVHAAAAIPPRGGGKMAL